MDPAGAACNYAPRFSADRLSLFRPYAYRRRPKLLIEARSRAAPRFSDLQGARKWENRAKRRGAVAGERTQRCGNSENSSQLEDIIHYMSNNRTRIFITSFIPQEGASGSLITCLSRETLN